MRNDERLRVAQVAARLMAEDGIDDFATAKRKAARQVGLADMRQLPTNEEVEAALRTHQTLYGGAEHDTRIRALRTRALRVMRDLERFNPYLTGSVLSGTAGKYATIELQVFAENEKTVELYLMQRGPYRAGQRRIWVGESARTAQTFTVDDDGTEIELLVLGIDDLRLPVKSTLEGRPAERARAPAVEALLDPAPSTPHANGEGGFET
jgi:hypothetical protein